MCLPSSSGVKGYCCSVSVIFSSCPIGIWWPLHIWHSAGSSAAPPGERFCSPSPLTLGSSVPKHFRQLWSRTILHYGPIRRRFSCTLSVDMTQGQDNRRIQRHAVWLQILLFVMTTGLHRLAISWILYGDTLGQLVILLRERIWGSNSDSA